MRVGSNGQTIVIDSSFWHTDLDRVRDSVSGLLYLVKYGKRDHLDDWIHNGTLRIRNAVSYAADKSPDRQDWETIRSYMTTQYATDYPSTQRIPAPPGTQSMSEIDVRPVSVEAVHSCPDYWMFSMSKSLSPDMLRLFGGSCCVVIGRPDPLWKRFLTEVADQLRSKKFNASSPDGTKLEPVRLPLRVATMCEVRYLGPPDDLDPTSIDWRTWMKRVGEGDELDHIFKKPAWYAHQDEVKFAWTHFDSEDIRQHNHRWRWTVEDVNTGEHHELIEALEDEDDAHWSYGLRLPPVMVDVTPPQEVIKLTLD